MTSFEPHSAKNLQKPIIDYAKLAGIWNTRVHMRHNNSHVEISAYSGYGYSPRIFCSKRSN